MLGPSHTRHPSISFQAAYHWRYKILLLGPVQGFVPLGSCFFVASRQNHVLRGIELTLFLMPDAWDGPIRASGGGGEELLRPHIETSKLADFNEDDNLKLSQLQNVLLLSTFSSLFNVAASTPAAKQHQIIVLIEGLTG